MVSGISAFGTSNRTVWQSRLEVAVGLLVVVMLVILMALAVLGRQRQHDKGYPLRASFSHIDGLDIGSDVRLAGVTVGHVLRTSIDPKTFQAQVTFSVDPAIHLPTDSGAIITSDSLLGGKYITLSPGGENTMLPSGGMIADTQGAISLEQLLSRFIFSVTDSLQKKNDTIPASSQGARP